MTTEDGTKDTAPVDVEEPKKQAVEPDESLVPVVKEKNCRRFGLPAVVAGIAMLALVLGLSLGLGLGGSNSNKETSAATGATTASSDTTDVIEHPPLNPKDAFTDILPTYTVKSLENPKSPQSLALSWLLEQDQVDSLSDERKTQLYALATFYFSFLGDAWAAEGSNSNEWLDLDGDRTECDWPANANFLIFGDDNEPHYQEETGPVCDANGNYENLHVLLQDLVPQSNYSMPAEIGLLTNLKTLGAQANVEGRLEGWIPSQLLKLQDLKTLELPMNAFTGPIPAAALPETIQRLDLSRNYLTGPIPSELPAGIEHLNLIRNSLSGELPTHLTQLTLLDLWINKMDGSIPTEIGLATGFQYLDLSRNSFTGPLPSQLGLLVDLHSWYAYDNSFSGTLPTEVGQMDSLLWLELARNKLEGPLPSQLSLLTNLKHLQLHHNSFTGSIPTELAMMPQLEYLTLFENSLTGPVPTEFGSMQSLRYLYLEGNNGIHGELPSELGMIKTLERLVLDGNNMTGTIPSDLAGATSLEVLALSSNPRMNGQIPDSLGTLTNLIELHLAFTALTGTVPEAVGALATSGRLLLLDITGTNITGTIPEGLCALNHRQGCTTSRTFKENLAFDTRVIRSCGVVFECSATLCGCDCPCE